MAKFAQYYLKYKLDDLFAQETKADRQKVHTDRYYDPPTS